MSRPVVWTKSSIIFTAHTTQPIICGRLFPSSHRFLLPPPPPIIPSLPAYEPPTKISISVDEHWLFGYFPGCEGEGLGCLWEREISLDFWVVKQWWNLPRGAGIVSCAWLGQTREVGLVISFPRLGLIALYLLVACL